MTLKRCSYIFFFNSPCSKSKLRVGMKYVSWHRQNEAIETIEDAKSKVLCESETFWSLRNRVICNFSCWIISIVIAEQKCTENRFSRPGSLPTFQPWSTPHHLINYPNPNQHTLFPIVATIIEAQAPSTNITLSDFLLETWHRIYSIGRGHNNVTPNRKLRQYFNPLSFFPYSSCCTYDTSCNPFPASCRIDLARYARQIVDTRGGNEINGTQYNNHHITNVETLPSYMLLLNEMGRVDGGKNLTALTW